VRKPGEYTVVGWHERAGERAARVRVQPGQAATVDLALPVEDSPWPARAALRDCSSRRSP